MFTVLFWLMVVGFVWVLFKIGGALLQILAFLAFGVLAVFLMGFAVGFFM